MVQVKTALGRYLPAVVLAVLVVIATVQAADPFTSPTKPTRVNLSDPPAEIATDALRILYVVNNTQTITAKYVHVQNQTSTGGANDTRVRTGITRQYRVMPENNSYWASLPYNRSNQSAPRVSEYGRENTGWKKWWIDDSWEEVGNLRYPIQQSSDPSAIEPGTVRTVDENATTLVLLVHDRSVAKAAAWGLVSRASDGGRLYLHIDKQSRRLERAVYVTGDQQPPPGWVRIVFEFSKYGQTHVPRPEGVPRYTLKDTLRDFSNGPLFRTWRLFPAL